MNQIMLRWAVISFFISNTNVFGAATSVNEFSISGGGYITRLAVAPSDSTIVFAGTDTGGIYKSTNSGGSYTSLNSSFWRSDQYGIDDIGIDPVNKNTIYILAGEYSEDETTSSAEAVGFGLWKSTNGGTTLSAVNPGYALTSVDTAGNPTWNTTRKSVYIRNDGRKMERLNLSAEKESHRRISDGKRIAFDPSSCGSGTCQTVYVADFKKGVFRSTDGGTNFYQLPMPEFQTSTSNYMRVSSINMIPYTVGSTKTYLQLVTTRMSHNGTDLTTIAQGKVYLVLNGGIKSTDWIDLSGSITGNIDPLDVAISAGTDLGSVSSTADVFYIANGKGGIIKGSFNSLDISSKTASVTFKQPSACSSGSWTATYGIGLTCDSTEDLSLQVGTYVAIEADATDTTGLKLYALGLSQGSVFYSSDGGTNWSSVYDSSSLNFGSSFFSGDTYKFADFVSSLVFDTSGYIIISDWWSTWKGKSAGSKSFTAYNSGIKNIAIHDIKNDPYNSAYAYIAASDHTYFYSTYWGVSNSYRGGTLPDTNQGVGVAVEASSDMKNTTTGLAKYVFLATHQLVEGTVGDLYISETNGTTWTSIRSSSIASGVPRSILYDKTFSGLWVAWYDTSGSTLYKVTGSGTSWTWTAVPSFTTSANFINTVKLFKSSSTSTTLYLLDENVGLYSINTSTLATTVIPTNISSSTCSNDGGSTPVTCSFYSATATTAGKIYIGTKGAGLWVSSDSGTTWTQLGTSDASNIYRNIRSVDVHPSDTTGNTIIVSGDSDVSDHWSSYYSATCTCTATTCTGSNGKICGKSGILVSLNGGSTFIDIDTYKTCSSYPVSSTYGKNINVGFQHTTNKYAYYFGTAGQSGYLIDWSKLKSCGLSLPF